MTMRSYTHEPTQACSENRTYADDAPNDAVPLHLPMLHQPQLPREKAECNGIAKNVHFEDWRYPGLEGVSIKKTYRLGHMFWIIKA